MRTRDCCPLDESRDCTRLSPILRRSAVVGDCGAHVGGFVGEDSLRCEGMGVDSCCAPPPARPRRPRFARREEHEHEGGGLHGALRLQPGAQAGGAGRGLPFPAVGAGQPQGTSSVTRRTQPTWGVSGCCWQATAQCSRAPIHSLDRHASSGTLLRQGNLLEGGRRQLDQSLCTAALAASYGIKHRSQPGRWRPAPAARGGPSQDADLGRILGADRLRRDKLAGTQLSP